jgi:hypothetical protein
MRLKLTTLICLSVLFSCLERKPDKDGMIKVDSTEDVVSQIDPRTASIANYIKDLKETQEVEFGEGDSWGTRYIYNNNDSSVIRVLIKSSAGDYGNGQYEFLLVDNKLIYQRDYIIDWLAIDPLPDTSDYQLSEIISFFNPDSTGLKESKSVYSLQLEVTNETIKKLENKVTEKKLLTKSDYVNSLEELKRAMALTMHEVE